MQAPEVAFPHLMPAIAYNVNFRFVESTCVIKHWYLCQSQPAVFTVSAVLRAIMCTASFDGWIFVQLLLLFAFRDLWKEWGDSFSDLFTELSVPPQAAGVIGTFECAFLDIILSTTVSILDLRDVRLFLHGLSFFVYTSIIFCKYTFHVCYVFNVNMTVF